MGRRSRTEVLSCGEDCIEMKLRDQQGNTATRIIEMTGSHFSVSDASNRHILMSFIHLADDIKTEIGEVEAEICSDVCSDEFGERKKIRTVKIRREDGIKYKIDLTSGSLTAVKTD